MRQIALWKKPLLADGEEKEPAEERDEIWKSTGTGWYVTKAGPAEQEFPHISPSFYPPLLPTTSIFHSLKQADLIADQ